MKPTVGRIMHFYRANGEGPLASIVTCVHGDTCVNLRVFGSGGGDWTETSVELTESPSKKHNCCCWPPR